jgi:hypothetical protein
MSTRKRSSTEKHGKASKIKKTLDCKDTGKEDGDIIHAGPSDIKVAASSPLQTKALEFSFYNQSCEDLAKALLGKKLVRLSDKGERLCGIIVETEAYLGHPDKAAHSYKGMTNKNEPMFMDPGTAYVYHIHSYCCMNISSKGNRKNILLYSQLTFHPAFCKHVLLQKNQLNNLKISETCQCQISLNE